MTEVLGLSELCRLYPNRWVAAKVLAREEEGGQPVRFEVVAAHSDMYSVRVNLEAGEHCILYTGNIPEEKFVLMY